MLLLAAYCLQYEDYLLVVASPAGSLCTSYKASDRLTYRTQNDLSQRAGNGSKRLLAKALKCDNAAL